MTVFYLVAKYKANSVFDVFIFCDINFCSSLTQLFVYQFFPIFLFCFNVTKRRKNSQMDTVTESIEKKIILLTV